MCVRFSSVSLFFFFKQKTAYEMRISDWSSDVCSSDLHVHRPTELVAVDLAILDVERSHRARILAGEAVAVAFDGENRLLVAHRRLGHAIIAAIDLGHRNPPTETNVN